MVICAAWDCCVRSQIFMPKSWIVGGKLSWGEGAEFSTRLVAGGVELLSAVGLNSHAAFASVWEGPVR